MKRVITIFLTLMMFAVHATCAGAAGSDSFSIQQNDSEAIVTNLSDAGGDVTVLIATYDEGGSLINVISQKTYIESGDSFSLNFADFGTHKVYVWDSAAETIISESSGDDMMFTVDYEGQQDDYENAFTSYRAGDTVELVFNAISADTDYFFYIDDQALTPEYDEERGYILRFTMPESDIKLTYTTHMNGDYDEEVVLVDYYSETVANVGGDGYYELVLYEYSDTEAKLYVYNKVEGKDETLEMYIVPHSVVEECNQIIDKYDMVKWSDFYDTPAMAGEYVSCDFLAADGEYANASTEAMPQNGTEILHSIGSAMEKYIKAEYKQKTAATE